MALEMTRSICSIDVRKSVLNQQSCKQVDVAPWAACLEDWNPWGIIRSFRHILRQSTRHCVRTRFFSAFKSLQNTQNMMYDGSITLGTAHNLTKAQYTWAKLNFRVTH